MSCTPDKQFRNGLLDLVVHYETYRWPNLVTLRYDVIQKLADKGGFVAIVIICCAICFVFGGSLGFLLGAVCAMASNKNQPRRETETAATANAWRTALASRMPPNHQYPIPQREPIE